MEFMDYLYNPVIIGVIASVLSYLYLRDEEDNAERKNTTIITSLVIGTVTWFVISSCQSYKNGENLTSDIIQGGNYSDNIFGSDMFDFSD